MDPSAAATKDAVSISAKTVSGDVKVSSAS